MLSHMVHACAKNKGMRSSVVIIFILREHTGNAPSISSSPLAATPTFKSSVYAIQY